MRKYSKSFSLIELIFAIAIMAVIASVALPKLFSISSSSSFVKLSSDLAAINNGLKNYKDSCIMKNISFDLDNLEDDEINLFSKILEHPIKNTHNYPFWSKSSNNTYLFHFSQTSELEFMYDKNELTFVCDGENTLCQKVME